MISGVQIPDKLKLEVDLSRNTTKRALSSPIYGIVRTTALPALSKRETPTHELVLPVLVLTRLGTSFQTGCMCCCAQMKMAFLHIQKNIHLLLQYQSKHVAV